MEYDHAFLHSHTFLLTGVRALGEHVHQPGVVHVTDRSVPADQAAPGAIDGECLCSIAIFTEGPGSVDLDGVSVPLRQGSAILLRPGGRFSVPTDPNRKCGWLIEFVICRVGEAAPVAGGFPLLPYHQEIAVRPLSGLCSLLERLAKTTGGSEEPLVLRRQAALLELLALLVESQQRSHRSADAAEAVEKTVGYVQEHFTESLTVEQLAGLAGVGRWQFSEQFRRLTGERPLDYINRLRMNRAKELLLLTDDPLREIAHNVGFRDECYFNRRFSRMFGCSPKAYAHSHKSAASERPHPPAGQVRLQPDPRANPPRLIVCGGILGDVLLLGVKPLGAELTVMGKQVVYRDLLAGIFDVGINGEAEAIAALRPDLVLLEKTGAASLLLADTAAIVSFGRTEAPSVRLRAIAALLGKERAADNWVARHEEAIRLMWSNLRSRIGTGEAATVLVQLGERLYVMGNQGLSATLYHPRGFRPSVGAEKIIASRERFREITADELSDYDGDRLFLLVSGDESSQREARRLVASPAWRRLRAFRSGNIHLAEAKWNYDDSLTRERLLPVLPHILASRL